MRVRLRVALVVLGTLFAAIPHGAIAANRLAPTQCGGFPLPYGTTIAVIGPIVGAERVASVVALGAVTSGNDLHARAWVVWDETGYAWLGIAQRSPAVLRRFWTNPEPPDFSAGVRVRFTPLTKPLPKPYHITDCPHTLPFAE